jgi:hypothetical protein
MCSSPLGEGKDIDLCNVEEKLKREMRKSGENRKEKEEIRKIKG